MARKTPDYTRQARKKKPAARGPARRPAHSRKETGGRRTAVPGVRAEAAAPAASWLVALAYAGCVVAAGLFVYGTVVASAGLDLPGIPGRDAIVALSGMLAGLVTAVFVLLLVNAVLDPRRRLPTRVRVRTLLYAALFFGMFTGLLVLSARVHLLILGAGFSLVVLVFSLAVRPRLGTHSSEDAAPPPRRTVSR